MPEKHKILSAYSYGVSTNNKDHHHPSSFTRKLLQWTFYLILPFIVFRLYFYPYPPHQTPNDSLRIEVGRIEEDESQSHRLAACDYTKGRWVPDKTGPLYNGTTCGTIKDGQNCMSHGRPDMGFLYWRWQPQSCNLPRFDPNDFLKLYSNRHIAFVGDSMARNQLESLLCMLSSVSSDHELVYTNGEDNKFRRWHFGGLHNVTVSIYWSPFLVKGVEKSRDGPDHNELYLDQIDERWGKDLGEIDLIVLSIGHWFLHPAVYFEGFDDNVNVLGCHYCPGMNHTEIGFYDVLRKAIRTTLNSISERRGDGVIDVVMTTFSPSHFEGEWDKFGACSKTKPYGEGEKVLEGMDGDMRKIEVEEVESFAAKSGKKVRFEVLDVTELSLMRPDGHPGAYMHPFPFANGVRERVQNDCVHWCLPGPVDTWNEILLQVMKRLLRNQ
ncbi:Xyloglucan O-acetyltransferase 1 [Linum grandiflorum]